MVKIAAEEIDQTQNPNEESSKKSKVKTKKTKVVKRKNAKIVKLKTANVQIKTSKQNYNSCFLLALIRFLIKNWDIQSQKI